MLIGQCIPRLLAYTNGPSDHAEGKSSQTAVNREVMTCHSVSGAHARSCNGNVSWSSRDNKDTSNLPPKKTLGCLAARLSPSATATEPHTLIPTEVPISLLPPHSPQWSPQPQTSLILCIPSPPPPSLSPPPTTGLHVSFYSKAIFPLQLSPLCLVFPSHPAPSCTVLHSLAARGGRDRGWQPV